MTFGQYIERIESLIEYLEELFGHSSSGLFSSQDIVDAVYDIKRNIQIDMEYYRDSKQKNACLKIIESSWSEIETSLKIDGKFTRQLKPALENLLQTLKKCAEVINEKAKRGLQKRKKLIQENRIFISYRRKDNIYAAHSIYDKLIKKYGKEFVFIDVNGIEGGEDFSEKLTKAVEQCKLLLVVMGERWLSILKERLNSREIDYVHKEIRDAILMKKNVISILLDNVEMIDPHELPEDLEKLANLEAMDVRPLPDFDTDIKRLINQISKILRIACKCKGCKNCTTPDKCCTRKLEDHRRKCGSCRKT